MILTFALLLGIYITSLWGAYQVSDEQIMEKWEQSTHTIRDEPKRWVVMQHYDGSKLDTFTDNLIFQKLRNKDQLPPLQAGMSNSGYVRYWFGTIAIVRPMLAYVDYTSIRYFAISLVFLLLILTTIQLYRYLGLAYCLVYGLCLGMIHFWIFPLSLQYLPIFVIFSLGQLLIIFLDRHQKANLYHWFWAFFIIASLTNFFDLLTAPLLTYAIPYALALCLKNRSEVRLFWDNLKLTLVSGLAWICGYSLTWISKWLIGSNILHQNIIKNAQHQAAIRTGGRAGEVLNYIDILRKLGITLLPKEARVILVIALVVSIIFLACHWRNLRWSTLISLSPMILVGMLPFIWLAIMKNHCNTHYYFTYRIFIIPILCGFYYLLALVKPHSNHSKN
ncbi:hypothetical protein [Vaginisenegalia massiliensis]|uniref:hypothetical protein n=1 Tax=Vaginisenegalia massiliensis TaxID=2058294 RepID=UPI000F52CE5C|nr:hypothetical protein [Vaginisenegalia massiliensis]